MAPKLAASVKAMQLGDMPDFDDMLDVALHGGKQGQPGLVASDARQKHIIIISDGDPGMPSPKLIKDCLDNKISISTVTVYTHTPGTRSPQMDQMAKLTHGRAYGPIEKNPNQLPQIFIKEATVVRRSLIFTDSKGIPVRYVPSDADIANGLESRRASGDRAGAHQQKAQPAGRDAPDRRRQWRSTAGLLAGGAWQSRGVYK